MRICCKKSSELNAFELLKDEFMAIVSHELNTPLTTLQSYVSRLKRRLYADEDERKEIVSKIENSVKKLILTTSDINTMNSYNLKKKPDYGSRGYRGDTRTDPAGSGDPFPQTQDVHPPGDRKRLGQTEGKLGRRAPNDL
ncbi:MAG: hypothetical protein LRZ88_06120 [Candidatus Cloacimonetes bacterium]|nr:hypothetical protein [Candidatus Cloacimonadota bacterium]